MIKHPRIVLVNTLYGLLRKAHGSRYFVSRGAIDYKSFPFDAQPYACSILIPEFKLYRPPSSTSDTVGTPLTITVEMVGRLRRVDPNKVLQGTPPTIDDDMLGEFVADIDNTIEQLKNFRDEQDNPVIFGMIPGSDQGIELMSEEYQIQGVAVTFKVTY